MDIISGIVAAVTTWLLNIFSRLVPQNRTLKKQLKELKYFEIKYKEVKTKLEASSVVKEYFQPVIIVGPRTVGKSSLVAQWHAPWNHSRPAATASHNTSTVPIYDFKQTNLEPHFADPDIKTKVL